MFPALLTSDNFRDFTSASQAALQFLQSRLGFSLWLVSRTEGNDWIVLQSLDEGYGVSKGTVLSWQDSFCTRMVRGEGPRVAPNSQDVPAYAEAPVGRQCAIGAYIGVPLVYEGELFGTLCAIDPNPQPENITAEQSMIELIASLLSSLLSSELKTLEANREAERAQAESFRDPVTQLYNRRGWEHFLALEEDRCQRYANPTCIFYVDLNGLKQVNDTYGHAAGDELIQRAAATLQSVARSQDIVARLGGDEFALLAVECDAISAVVLRERLDAALVNAQLSASVGMAQRDPARGLAHAFEEADKAMYCEKQRHRLTQKML